MAKKSGGMDRRKWLASDQEHRVFVATYGKVQHRRCEDPGAEILLLVDRIIEDASHLRRVFAKGPRDVETSDVALACGIVESAKCIPRLLSKVEATLARLDGAK